MSTFFLHAFLPFLLDWLCWAGAPTIEEADNFFSGLKAGVEACLLFDFDFVGAMVKAESCVGSRAGIGPVITTIGSSTSYSQSTHILQKVLRHRLRGSIRDFRSATAVLSSLDVPPLSQSLSPSKVHPEIRLLRD